MQDIGKGSALTRGLTIKARARAMRRSERNKKLCLCFGGVTDRSLATSVSPPSSPETLSHSSHGVEKAQGGIGNRRLGPLVHK